MNQSAASTYALNAPSVGRPFKNRVSNYRQVRRLGNTVPFKWGAPRAFRLLNLGPDKALKQRVTQTYAHREPFGRTPSKASANSNCGRNNNRGNNRQTLPLNPKPRKSGVDRSANACAIVLGQPRAKAHFSRTDGRTHVGVWLVGPHQASSQLKRKPSEWPQAWFVAPCCPA